MDHVRCHNLWIPASEAQLYERYGEFEGLPDVDVGKVARVIALFPDRRRALDIGAHIGAISAFLARHFETVVAFEAAAETYRTLCMNVGQVPNIQPRNQAVGPAAGEVYFDFYPYHGQLSHVASDTETAGGPEADAPVEGMPRYNVRVGPIPAVAIDDLGYDDVSFIKIDVEGFELPVLEGARATILRCRPAILFEQGGNDVKHFGRPLNEASDFLAALGMEEHPEAPVKMSKDKLYRFPGA